MLQRIDAPSIALRSERMAALLASTDEWHASTAILCFLSMPAEVDTGSLISRAKAEGKSVAVPRIKDGRLHFVLLGSDPGVLPRDSLGIPVPDARWPSFTPGRGGAKGVLVVVPGLAFDRGRNRLGRGGGYYDRFLREGRQDPSLGVMAIGVCFAEQIVETVPCDQADQPVDAVVTDIEILR